MKSRVLKMILALKTMWIPLVVSTSIDRCWRFETKSDFDVSNPTCSMNVTQKRRENPWECSIWAFEVRKSGEGGCLGLWFRIGNESPRETKRDCGERGRENDVSTHIFRLYISETDGSDSPTQLNLRTRLNRELGRVWPELKRVWTRDLK